MAAQESEKAPLSPGMPRLGESHMSDWQRNPLLSFAIVFSIFGVLIADIATPLGVAVWVVYLVPVTLSFGMWRPEMPILLAGISTILMGITFMTDQKGVDQTIAQINRGFGILTVWVMATAGFFFIKNRLAVRHQQWLQRGRAGLSEVMAGEQPPESFGAAVLKYLAEFLNAHAGAMFIGEGEHFERIATYGVPDKAPVPRSFTPHDGLLGQAVKDRQPLAVRPVPDGYLWLGSALGQSKPLSLFIAPLQVDGRVNAVLELGFLHAVKETIPEFFEAISESLGVAVRSGKYRTNLRNALDETQRQAEELQVQSEELRVANEELEEQSRALEESQSRLEQQQVELEQINTQLEEQNQMLESQRDELARARGAVEAKAREVERESRYKSAFLANMSHELRTPLNSSLILARLLADNREGNLTEDQVTSAKTILSAGNDLLTLINDILDLSKIEAGRVEVRPEIVPLADLVDDLSKTLLPLAEQKGLRFEVELTRRAPETIYTDRQRLEQVLKNLLSNAIKFTDQGVVSLKVKNLPEGKVGFEIMDTGIGIPEDQHDVIFQAFKQVDGTTNRKFSGTGLGLSISQELARLLGGEIHLQSELGEGSTFSLILPKMFDPSLTPPALRPLESDDAAAPPPQSIHVAPPRQDDREKVKPSVPTPQRIPDDRNVLHSGGKGILIVEDDEPFARILYDVAHELDFQCLIATSAEEALVMAVQYLPSAIVLDIGLPDQSGLSVLDRLKHDSRTRHIPVHIVSGSDYTDTAFSLGAVGYILKPVTREKLVEALQGVETRLSQRIRRLLIVEDDEVQLDSMRKLFSAGDVEIEGARSAAECLEKLKDTTFDCMVLDLSLPDASGFSLLETLAREEDYSFPPVIVYTGRDITPEEEHKLRMYSKSIIIKGAKSPERLLDEVTLFLHQVVANLPPEKQQMIQKARSREEVFDGRRILIVEDDVRNLFALTSILEPRGVMIEIARNGREALERLEATLGEDSKQIDLVLMDVMMPEMDGLSATREIRKRDEWKKLPIIVLTAKAMKDDQEACFEAGANDYLAKPLDVDKLLSLVRVWIRR